MSTVWGRHLLWLYQEDGIRAAQNLYDAADALEDAAEQPQRVLYLRYWGDRFAVGMV